MIKMTIHCRVYQRVCKVRGSRICVFRVMSVAGMVESKRSSWMIVAGSGGWSSRRSMARRLLQVAVSVEAQECS